MKHSLRATLSIAPMLVFCGLIAACSGGDDQKSEASSLPNTEQATIAAQDQFATTAQSLPSPAPAATPTLRSIPSAPDDGPPPLLPRSTTTKLAFADSLGPGPLLPSILRRTVVSGLTAPTDLVFSTDGALFFVERGRGLFAMRPGSPAAPIFEPRDLAKGNATGMLAVALDPEFERNRFAYVFMRSTTTGAEDSRVVRITVNPSSTQSTDRRDILVVPDEPKANESAGDEKHLGGALRFGPDGHLYVGLGDGNAASASQSGMAINGKVLRIDRDGRAAPGNNAPPGFDKRVFAFGLRDPVALAFHPNTEAALVGQRRKDQPDDISMAKPGANIGWDPRCAPPKTGYCERSMEQTNAGASSGIVAAWRGGKPAEGLSAIERLRDPMWRDWRNAFVVAFDKAQRLDLVKLGADGRTLQATPALEKLGVGFRAIAQGPDGLYVATSGKAGGEEIWRLSAQ